MHIERTRGDTYADEFTITLKETWEPANLAGATFVLILDSRKEPSDNSTQIYQLIGQVDLETSTVKCAPSADQADRLGRFYYDLKMTDATGAIRTILSGQYLYK